MVANLSELYQLAFSLFPEKEPITGFTQIVFRNRRVSLDEIEVFHPVYAKLRPPKRRPTEDANEEEIKKGSRKKFKK